MAAPFLLLSRENLTFPLLSDGMRPGRVDGGQPLTATAMERSRMPGMLSRALFGALAAAASDLLPAQETSSTSHNG